MFTPELTCFAAAERCALRLDGHVVTCSGLAMCVDTVPSVDVRLGSMLADMRCDTVVVLEAAMWVWGFLPQPPRKISVTTVSRRRVHGLPRHFRNVEILLQDDDVEAVSGRRVTTVQRTLTDIARFIESDRVALYLMSLMKNSPGVNMGDALESIAPYSTHANRARRRLGAHLADPIDVVDTVDTPNRVKETLEV